MDTTTRKTPVIETLQRPKDEQSYSLSDAMLVLTPNLDGYGNVASGGPRVVNRLGRLTDEEQVKLKGIVKILF